MALSRMVDWSGGEVCPACLSGRAGRDSTTEMIPPLQSDGTPLPGTHDATRDELLAAYPAGNAQRHMLNDSLSVVVNQLWRLDPTLVILVDGSYVTAKAEPNDIDLLIITAT
jgi:hypothetical protein